MGQLQLSLVYATATGAMIPLGAWLARVEHIQPRWLELEFRHFVTAFGGGALLAAVSLVLVPDGISYLSSASSVAAIFAGALFFFWMERMLATGKGSLGQTVAMVSDFVPEAMGAMFASGQSTAQLLAFLIGLQNLPEGFNAYRELKSRTAHSSAALMWPLIATALVGPVAAALGHFYLVETPALMGFVMLFAAGGILYLIFQDIAPQVPLRRHWAPPLGAVGGFTLGLLGHILVY